MYNTSSDEGQLLVPVGVYVNNDAAAMQGPLCAVKRHPWSPVERRPAKRVAGSASLSVPCLA